MTDDPVPKYRTGTLWAVLTVLLLIGTVAAAFVVYGLTDLLATRRFLIDVPLLVLAGFVASTAMLLMTGILYRVDRVRGVPHRTVKLFD